jgi:predicted phosphodiesterase
MISYSLLAFSNEEIKLDWKRIKESELPQSIEIYETNDIIGDSKIHAVYAKIDLTDPKLALDVKYVGTENVYKTPKQFTEEEDSGVYICMNAGYFNWKRSVSLVVSDSKILEPANNKVYRKIGDEKKPFYPTRSAFGINQTGKMDVSWSFNLNNKTYRYDIPHSVDDQNLLYSTNKPPTTTTPQGAKAWNLKYGVGGGPILLKEGLINITDKEECFSQIKGKNPRTAIGYTKDQKLLMLVVDGRQKSLSMGASFEELAGIMKGIGAYGAVNLDGGGSSAMVVNKKLVTSPSDKGNRMRKVPSVIMIKKKQNLTLKLPQKRDYRIAVVSDLNSSYGSTSYTWQVNNTFDRIINQFDVDMITCAGDMVAGQSSKLSKTKIKKMWAAFDEKIYTKLNKSKIPFFFTLGNHDAGLSNDIQEAENYWRTKTIFNNFYDKAEYPKYFSALFHKKEIFIASIYAKSSKINKDCKLWLQNQLQNEKVQNAKYRIIVGHLPLYPIAKGRESSGNNISNPEELKQIMKKGNVDLYISGHHHAYYLSKEDNFVMLSAGAIGDGPRKYLGTNRKSKRVVTFIDFNSKEENVRFISIDIDSNQIVPLQKLPPLIENNGYKIIRMDLGSVIK